jgi:ribosome-binding factor A
LHTAAPGGKTAALLLTRTLPIVFSQTINPGRRDHKTAQLCRQVFQTLSLALSECGDDLLRDLILHDVQPAPNPSRLLARVGFSASVKDPVGPVEVLQRLGEASGFLRHQVAAAITRKRAPEIFFALVASGEEMR